MRLTTKGRFAVTAMVDLAIRGGKDPVTLASISERQKISLSYLEQLFGKLRRHHIVESVRGPGGGYYLARPSSEISVADVIVAVDEPMDATKCGGKGDCHDDQQCITHDLWMGLNDALYRHLAAVNLQQLVDGHGKPKAGVMPVTLNKRITRPEIASV
ncbi:MAG: Rrf2 family transcriptional regulator [Gallionellaceae bacterium]|nr:Rrf2 family transcriptional regulator [Gallionellaceae bacterium]